jgi:hypothetical protein
MAGYGVEVAEGAGDGEGSAESDSLADERQPVVRTRRRQLDSDLLETFGIREGGFVKLIFT